MTDKQKEAISFLKRLRYGDKVENWEFLSDCQIVLVELVEQHEIEIQQLKKAINQLQFDWLHNNQIP